MKKIDEFISVLEDGQWHDMESLSAKTGISQAKVEAVTEFLAANGFVQVEKGSILKVKLADSVLEFFRRLTQIDKESE